MVELHLTSASPGFECKYIIAYEINASHIPVLSRQGKQFPAVIDSLAFAVLCEDAELFFLREDAELFFSSVTLPCFSIFRIFAEFCKVHLYTYK